jgi:cytochrome c peroxidase
MSPGFNSVRWSMTLSVGRFGPASRGTARAVLAAFLSALAACYAEPSVSEPPFAPSLDVQLRESFQQWGGVFPILAVPPQNPALVDLGRALFFDKVLSGNRDVSCATCHDPADHGGDGMSLAVGTGGVGAGSARLPGPGRRFVPRNAPSMLNQGLAFPYIFWDGRLTEFRFTGPDGVPPGPNLPPGLSTLLASQAMLPVLNRTEMRGEKGDRDRFGNVNELAQFGDSASTEIWSAVMKRLLGLTEYVARFQAAFPGTPVAALGFQHAANAIAAFELEAFTRTNSPFDRFLWRDTRAMSDDAKRGGILFFGEARCAQCHNGPMLGGQQFANIGIPQAGPGVGASAPLDIGAAETIPQASAFYRFAFRVAPLRNVELTAPYMHNGVYPSLEVVVRHYTNADSALRFYDSSQLPPALRGTHHGDAATVSAILSNLDGRVRQPIALTATQQRQIVAFLESLTDPAARDLRHIAPAAVPSGLPVRE